MSELSRETDALLSQGRDGEPLAPEDRARLKRAVLANIAGATVVTTTTTAAAAWTTVAAKVVTVAVLVGSVAGVAVVATTRTPDVAREAKHARLSSVGSSVQSARPIPRSVPVATALPVPAASAPPVLSPVVPQATLLAAPVTSPAATSVPSLAHAVAPEPSAASTLPAQTELFHDADLALLRGDAVESLRLLDEHVSRFPTSTLAPERSAERVFALCLAGRHDEARQAATEFFRLETTGPLAARVRAACGAVAP